MIRIQAFVHSIAVLLVIVLSFEQFLLIRIVRPSIDLLVAASTFFADPNNLCHAMHAARMAAQII